jgi:serine/threonine-protein kinase
MEDGVPLAIVHRDVSPQNVLVGFDGIARLADFGVATGAWRRESTDADAITGKLGYMAPEQLHGRGDLRADLFAAGVVLWELLTGRRFRDAGLQVLIQIMQGEATPPSQHCGEAQVLDEVLMRALRREPNERFESARAMASAMVAAVPPASTERVAEVVRHLLGVPAEGQDRHAAA